MAAGMSFVTAPAQAAFELPEGERITHVSVIARGIPQKEEYELYDPKIGKNFDIKNFWMRADLRVRPEMRNSACFGNTFATSTGSCNNSAANTGTKGKTNDFYVQQMVRLGIGYDLSPDLNFYFELIDSRTWGGNGTTGIGNGGNIDALNQNGGNSTFSSTLGVRAAYVLVRNLASVQGLSMKAGRQYIVFGSQSLFGHFDWSNTGYSHDGVMFQYSTKAFDSHFGWIRTAETDLAQAAPVGSVGNNVAGSQTGNGNADGNMFIFYNQIKSVPAFLIEPYYIYYKNGLGGQPADFSAAANNQGLGTPKHPNQTRHMIGNRFEMREGNFDAQNEISYQFGAMGDNGGANAGTGNEKNLHINAWATRSWIGYTFYQSDWKPRLAFNFDYASGDGRANCTSATGAGTGCKSANTFENFFPTNHIHMGYMDVQGWKNMLSPSVNFQFRPSKDDHVEFWYTNLNLASSKDNWYRAGQGVYVYSQVGNTKTHIGDEVDFAWTHMFMDGKLSFQTAYGHLWAGGYIAQNLGGKAVGQDWAYAQLWMNF
jgi:hypothetical protein